MLRRLISYHETYDLDLDDPSTTRLRRDILQKNILLSKVYREWYTLIIKELPENSGPVLELGTGPGFLKVLETSLITSEIQWIPGIDLVLNGQALPFPNGSLRAIVMTNVLHHIPRVALFFSEAVRCLADGGKVVMIEPWLTDWSRLIYRNFHHEPVDPDMPGWEFPPGGPLSSANGALPWIIFKRDQEIFTNSFPKLHIMRVDPFMPFLYLATGGFSSRYHLPGWTFSMWKWIETVLRRWRSHLAMFALITLQKKS